MHLNHYENPYSRLARYELRMRQHMVHSPGYADDLRQYTSLNNDCAFQVWALSYLTDGGNEQIQMVRVSLLDPR